MSLLRNSLYLLLLVSFFLTSCTSKPDTDSIVTIQTSKGDIVLILFDDTPKHKASFINFAKKGNYDSTSFHRVIKDFMIQGGDIKENPNAQADYNKLIPAEIRANHRNVRGAVGAPRQMDNINPDRSSSTQFYIVSGKVFTELEMTTDLAKLNQNFTRFLQSERHAPLLEEFIALEDSGRTEEIQQRILSYKDSISSMLNVNLDKKGVTQEEIEIYTTQGGAPHLDGTYTVFGQVLKGMDVVEAIDEVEVDVSDTPLNKITMTMKVEELPRSEITRIYGYQYPIEE